MTPAEAYHVLQLEPGAGREQIERQFAEQKQVLRARRARAHAPGLKAHIQQGLSRLDTARDVLLHRAELASGVTRHRREETQALLSGPTVRGDRSVTAADIDAVVDRLPRRLSRHAEGLARALLAVLAGAGIGAVLVLLPVVSEDHRAGIVGGGALIGLVAGLLGWRATVGRLRREEWVKVREARVRGEHRPVAWRRPGLRLALALLLFLFVGTGYRPWGSIFPAAKDEPLKGPVRVAEYPLINDEPGVVVDVGAPSEPAASDAVPRQEGGGLPEAESGAGKDARWPPAGSGGPERPWASFTPSSGAATPPMDVAAPAQPIGPGVRVDADQEGDPRGSENTPGHDPGTVGNGPNGIGRTPVAGGQGAQARPDAAPAPSDARRRTADASGFAGRAGLRSAAAIVRAETLRESDGEDAATRAGLALAYRAWAAELREAKQSGLALYALERAAASGGADDALASTLREDFMAAHALIVETAPPRVRIAPGSGWPGTKAEAEALGAALDIWLRDSLGSVLPPLVVLEPTDPVAGRDTRRPQLVLWIEAEAAEETGSSEAGEDPGNADESVSGAPQARRLTLSASVVLTRREGKEEDRVLVKEVTTLSPGAARSGESLAPAPAAERAALQEALRLRLRARRLELLTNLAGATLALAQARRETMKGEAEDIPGNLEWGWFAIWTEAGLPLPQHEAERVARQALALPEARAVGP